MRPLSLEIEGFTSFRERVSIDFRDADLFVLSGPMGAGKSSIIDALGFALYGSIARFQNKSLVAPVISQGLQETKVQLDFSLGEAQYSAVRVVRRNKNGGATTPEARLYQGSTLLASDAEGVTKEVERLLGLTFDQFTKCVMLPQGEFAELLHAKPAERQELLVRLLDIGLYRKIGERARSRVARGEGALNELRSRLENELRNVTQEAYDAQEKKVDALSKLVERLDAEEATLLELTKAADEHRLAANNALSLVKLLEAVQVPAGVNDLVSRLDAATKAEAAALKRETEAAAEVEALEKQREAMPDLAEIEATLNVYRELKKVRDRIAAAETQVAEAGTVLKTAEQDAATATKVLEDAVAARDAILRADSAYHASQGLKKGDICPVCGEVLTAAPALKPPAGSDKAEAAVKKAERSKLEHDQRYRQLSTSMAGVSQAIEQDRVQLKAIEDQLKGKASARETYDLSLAIKKADEELNAARQKERAVRQGHAVAQNALDAVKRDEQGAWNKLHSARAPVATLGAPEPEGTLEQSWDALVAWSRTSAVEQRLVQNAAQEQEAAVRQQEHELRQRQIALATDAGLQLAGRPVRDTALQEKARAERELQHIDERLTERLGVERDLEAATKKTATAKLLGTHLDARHFERWYLQEAMTRLVRGATERMQDLTDNQYSLDVNSTGTDFVVIDHINANEQRPVRTLSGGETFLASLSLALALGDDIASLAARGASRLDALFLDEGFGSLDQNTLETVASTIEELGARGRMVGIVTHVQELADRIPVQYQVSKVNGSSSVERVDHG